MTRPIKLLITLSLLLNLLLMGVVAGHTGQYYFHSHFMRDSESALATLPAEKRALFENAMKRAEDDTQQSRKDMMDAREKAAAILKTAPFDKAAYLAQIERINSLHAKIMERMSLALAYVAAQYTPEERAVLAEIVRHPPHMSDGGPEKHPPHN